MDDLISRQAAIDAVNQYNFDFPQYMERFVTKLRDAMKADLKHDIEALPSAQPERDMPMKPMETTDRTWGIPKRQAVCPRCDYYLPRVHFLEEGTSKSKCRKITYCDTCGQAIDWEGWEDDG